MMKTKQEIIKRLDKYKVKKYTINDDLTVDVDGNVMLNSRRLYEIPFQFGNVTGCFTCYNNELSSLKHCPKYVGGYFDCSSNLLNSLEHCPKHIVSDFVCSNNKLTSLEHCTRYVGGNFQCFNNKLTSLEHCPRYVGGHFACTGNPLKTIEELLYIQIKNELIAVPEHLKYSKEYKLLQKVRKLC